MRWTDTGIVLATRRHGETGLIVEALTATRGPMRGFARGGRGPRLAALYQPGNTLQLTWSGRTAEQLGHWTAEAERLRAAALIAGGVSLLLANHALALARLLPEAEPAEGLHAALTLLLDHATEPAIAAPLLVRFELGVLAGLGFGLDLTCCAATGVREGLVYVSPRSAQAVAAKPGAPYADRLLPLPAFLRDGSAPDAEALAAGFRLTGHFLERDVLEPRQPTLKAARDGLVAALLRAVAHIPTG